MSCSQDPHWIYLYLAGELGKKEKTAYEKHLTECATCQQSLAEAEHIFQELKTLEMAEPDPAIVETILNVSRNRKVKSKWQKVQSKVKAWFAPRNLVWEVAFSTAVIVLLLYIRPFQQEMVVKKNNNLAWEDNFYSEVDWMDQEINRVESGELISSYAHSDVSSETEEEWLSPMSMDLPAIREQVQDIVTGIYGI